MTDELTLSLNYTIGTGDAPSVELVTSNCLNSLVLQENHARDTLFQDELEELALLQQYITTNTSYLALVERSIHYKKLLLPPKPPPPPPPPPVGADAPPAPPTSVTPETLLARIQDTLEAMEARSLALLEEVDGCFGTRRSACGLPKFQAPNPWLSRDGAPCRGYATLQTRELDYCGYWCATKRTLTRLDSRLHARLHARRNG